MKPELVVALDVPLSVDIPQLIDPLPSEITWYKIGLELFTNEGPGTFNYLRDNGKSIFLDLKLHDIPRTVARAVRAASGHGVAMLTIHAGGGCDMLKAAAESAREQDDPLKLVAVTTLTSLNDKDLRDLGVSRPLAEHTMILGEMAISAGIDGLVCSPLEAQTFRQRFGETAVLVTPGIRPEGSTAGDQKRIATPGEAVKSGSNFLVVGRPILGAADPGEVAKEIIRQMNSAMSA